MNRRFRYNPQTGKTDLVSEEPVSKPTPAPLDTKKTGVPFDVLKKKVEEEKMLRGNPFDDAEHSEK